MGFKVKIISLTFLTHLIGFAGGGGIIVLSLLLLNISEKRDSYDMRKIRLNCDEITI